MNEKLKGYRTVLLTFITMLISMLDTLRETVQQILSIIDVQIGDGGSVAIFMASVIGLKAIITDAIPKLKIQFRDE